MKILIVSKKTDLEYDESKWRTQLRGYYEKNNTNIQDKIKRHDEHYATLESLVSAIKKEGIEPDIITRESHSTFDFENRWDRVISVGGDGIFMDVAGYILDDTHIVGVTSNNRSVGAHCSIMPKTISALIPKLIDGNYHLEKRLRMQATIHNEFLPKDVAVNDIYVGAKLSTPFSRLKVIKNNKIEHTGGSGIIISTYTGKSGWYDNIILGKKDKDGRLTICKDAEFDEHDKEIIRYKAINPQYGHIYGKISLGETLDIISDTRDECWAVFDGNHERRGYTIPRDFLATIKISDKPLYVVKF